MQITVGDANANRARIYLDGKPVELCKTADEDAGFVDSYVTDEEDLSFLEIVAPASYDEAIVKRCYGKVEIRFDKLA